jgi:hypothetical protein
LVCDFPALKWIIFFFWYNFWERTLKIRKINSRISINSLKDFPLFSCKICIWISNKKEDFRKRLYKFLWEKIQKIQRKQLNVKKIKMKRLDRSRYCLLKLCLKYFVFRITWMFWCSSNKIYVALNLWKLIC